MPASPNFEFLQVHDPQLARLGSLAERYFADDPNGNSQRVDQGEEGRFRCFTREQITKRGENLDISWLRDESLQSRDDLPEPEVIATEIIEKLRIATKEMEALMVLLEGEEAAEAVSASVGLPTVE